MILDVADLETRLRETPGDWEARLKLMERHLREGNRDAARRLVREAPDEGPLPPDIQARIHSLLTEPIGAPPAANAAAPAAAVEPPTSSEMEKAALEWTRRRQKQRRQKGGTVLELPENSDHRDARKPLKAFRQGGTATKRRGEEDDSKPESPPPPRLRPSKSDHAGIQAKSGLLQVPGVSEAGADLPEHAPAERPPVVAEKVSAFAMAMLVHLLVALSFSFVVIALPVIQPPHLVVNTASHSDDVIIDQMKLLKPTERPAPSAAAPQEAFVISSMGPSNVTVPDFDKQRSTEIVSPIAGTQIDGVGFSFRGSLGDTSDVNFFGIKSGGNRIVFVVDTTPAMLIDEKGGMFAYDKVKDEIAFMLQGLNRGTSFNLILYQGNRVASFREQPIPGLPSNVRQAIEWLAPLNRDYENLGLLGDYMENPVVVTGDVGDIKADEISGYAKAIQAAMEMDANAIFCIASGYETIRRLPDEETRRRMRENPGTPGTVDPKESEAWRKAVEETREWLQKENAARTEKGLPPKVVLNFAQLVREVTGATPPRAQGGTPPAVQAPTLPPYTPEEIEQHLRDIARAVVRRSPGSSEPAVHLVLFLGKKEDIGEQEEHFKRLTRKNHGKLKLLRGLDALKDVTGKG